MFTNANESLSRSVLILKQSVSISFISAANLSNRSMVKPTRPITPPLGKFCTNSRVVRPRIFSLLYQPWKQLGRKVSGPI